MRFLLLLLMLSLPLRAAELTEKAVDMLAAEALAAFKVPGMAVAVVKEGETRLLKGYGLRDVERRLPVTPATQFRIGSTSKAFTTAALALLVQEGRLGWDDKVTAHLPDFRLYDPAVTHAFTLRDLLTHRSGLWSGAGDFLLWPAPSGFSRAEVIERLRYFKPVTPFRTAYAYNNAFYVTAGEVVRAASGMGYEDFVERRLLQPLGIDCHAGAVPASALEDAAEPYVPFEGKPLRVERNRLNGEPAMMAAAGGIACSGAAMARWMTALLAGGEGVLAAERLAELWTGVTPMPVTSRERERDGTTHRAYALGWRVADMKGHETVSHTGAILGFQSQVMLVPSLKLGIALLDNGTGSRARSAVMQALLMAYLAPAETPRNWIAEFSPPRAKAAKPQVFPDTVELPLAAYEGLYSDEWYGDVTIARRADGSLGFRSVRMPALTGRMLPREGHAFLVKWDDPTAEADFIARFEPDEAGRIAGMRLIYTAASKGAVTDLDAMHFLRGN